MLVVLCSIIYIVTGCATTYCNALCCIILIKLRNKHCGHINARKQVLQLQKHSQSIETERSFISKGSNTTSVDISCQCRVRLKMRQLEADFANIYQ